MLRSEEEHILRSLVRVDSEQGDKSYLDAYATLLESHIKFSEEFKIIFDFVKQYYENSVGFPSYSDTIHYFKNKSLYNIVKHVESLGKLPRLNSEEFQYRYKSYKKSCDLEIVTRALNNSLDFISQNRQDETLLESLAEKAITLFSEETSELYITNSVIRTSGGLDDAYEEFKKELDMSLVSGTKEVMPSGVHMIDQYIGGLKRGNIAFICGYAGSFKTGSCLNWALNSLKLGYNVLYISMENNYQEILCQFMSCHAANMKVFGAICQRPPTHTDIIDGNLSKEQRELVNTAYQDILVKSSSMHYGNLYIDHPIQNPTLSYIRNISAFYNAKCGESLDLIVIDSPNLIVPEDNSPERDSRNAIIRGLKLFAGSFNRGKGVALLCPHQINRDGHERAKKNKDFIYDHKCIADLNEIERSADVAITIFSDDEDLRLKNLLLVQFLKTRHHGAPKYQNFPISVDMGTRRWDNCKMDQNMAFDESFDFTAAMEDDDSLEI